jgi:enterochelin esterase-like enzyme
LAGVSSIVVHLLAAVASAFLLPGFTQVAAGPNGGQVLSGTVPGTPRAAYVYLPPGLDPARRYPVVYLLHGLPGSPSEYVVGAELARFADQGIAAGKLEPFIAVMPAAGQTSSYGGEWAGPWESELIDDVLPFVDAHLPVVAAARDRIIAGLSAGGFGALDIMLRHPGLFDTAESWSGYFHPLGDGPFAGADAATLAAHDPVALAQAEAPELRANGARFFISTGPAHSRLINPASSRAFAGELHRLGLPAAYRSFPSKDGMWRDQLAAGLTWALAA